MPAKVAHFTQVEEQVFEEPSARGLKVRWLITREDGAENFAMRLFELEPQGYSPHHTHDWEHEVYVLEGRGVIKIGDVEHEVEPGYFAFIPPNEPHSIINRGDKPLRFLCLIPYK